MPVLAISDVAWQGFFAAVMTVVLAWMGRRTRDAVVQASSRAEGAAREAAGRVELVRRVLEDNSATVAEKLETIRSLVNNQTHVALATIARQAEQIADLTGDPADRDAARVARATLRDHDERQRALDEGIRRRREGGGEGGDRP